MSRYFGFHLLAPAPSEPAKICTFVIPSETRDQAVTCATTISERRRERVLQRFEPEASSP